MCKGVDCLRIAHQDAKQGTHRWTFGRDRKSLQPSVFLGPRVGILVCLVTKTANSTIGTPARIAEFCSSKGGGHPKKSSPGEKTIEVTDCAKEITHGPDFGKDCEAQPRPMFRALPQNIQKILLRARKNLGHPNHEQMARALRDPVVGLRPYSKLCET